MNKNIKFQILDCEVFNEEIVDDDDGSDFSSSSDEDDKRFSEKKEIVCDKKFIIQLYGRTLSGKSISVSVTDFTPFFFVKVPEHWDKNNVKKFGNYVRGEMLPKYRENLLSVKLMKKQEFYGFTDFEKFPFARFVFSNTVALRNCKKIFQKNFYYTGDSVKLAYIESAGEYGNSRAGMTKTEIKRKEKREKLLKDKKRLETLLKSILSRKNLRF